MGATIHQGHPARVDATACILPISEAMHIRGELGRQFVPVAGPILQQEALRRAPATMGSVVSVGGAGASYQRIYLAVCYPFRPDGINWRLVEQTLLKALHQAEQEGHRAIALPLFVDAPMADPSRTLPVAAAIMHRCAAALTQAHVKLMAWNPYQEELLKQTQAAFADTLRQAAITQTPAPEPESVLVDPEPAPEPVKQAPKTAPKSRTAAKKPPAKSGKGGGPPKPREI